MTSCGYVSLHSDSWTLSGFISSLPQAYPHAPEVSARQQLDLLRPSKTSEFALPFPRLELSVVEAANIWAFLGGPEGQDNSRWTSIADGDSYRKE